MGQGLEPYFMSKAGRHGGSAHQGFRQGANPKVAQRQFANAIRFENDDFRELVWKFPMKS
jgi:hypothetical protein